MNSNITSMATQTPSNSLLLTTLPHSRSVSRKPRQLTVFAKNDTSSSTTSSSSSSGTSFSPLQLNWGNITEVKSLIPVVSNPLTLGGARPKDAGTVFVAGATGQVGVRVAQMLLREGFRVRAGVPDLGAAQELARFASDYKIISREESKRLNAVEFMFNDSELTAKAIGNASKVVVTIGSTENGPTKEVTAADALQVVEAAQLAGVSHLAIIYDESASTASTNNVLDGISSFFSNLFSRSQPLTMSEFLEKIIQTDVRYTFIKTALTDDFSPESSYNVVVAPEGRPVAKETTTKVPRAQMAALVAGLLSNTVVAENKVVEVYTDQSAPLKSPNELFSVIPEDGRRKAYAEAFAKAKAEGEAEEEEDIRATKAMAAKKRFDEEAKKRSEKEVGDDKKAEEVVTSSVNGLLNKAKGWGSGLSWDKFGTNLVKAGDNGAPGTKIATARGQAKARDLVAEKAVVIKQPSRKPNPKPAPKQKATPMVSEETKVNNEAKQVRNILGGLFKQETIYVDDD